MQDHYWIIIRNCLLGEVQTHAANEIGNIEALKDRLILRPPKQQGIGDLCTNIVQILGGTQDGNCMMQADLIRSNIQALECVAGVSLSDNGYLNITLAKEFLVSDLLLIEEETNLYGLKGLDEHCSLVDICEPDHDDDLRALRQSYNAKYLLKLAQLAKVQTKISSWRADDLRGYPTATAVAKCGENVLKLCLLGNGTDFSIHFSPSLASDKAYDNPAFCLLYAEACLTRLLKNQRNILKDETVLLESPNLKSLAQTDAQNLFIQLLQWPLAVRQTLRDGDMLNLVSFLQQISLLFFRLNDREKLQSSNYLCEKSDMSTRLQLLRATKCLLSAGLDLMEIDRAEEFI